jgi:hypothetical protein
VLQKCHTSAFRWGLHPDKLDPILGGRLNPPRVALGDQITQIDPAPRIWLANTHVVGLAHDRIPSKTVLVGVVKLGQRSIP